MTDLDTRIGSRSETPPTAARRKPWWMVLIVLCLAQLMIVLDSTIVNIALPSAQRDLGFTDSTRQWVITAYALTFGTLLLLGGKLADLLGRRRTLFVGLIGFAAVSAVAGAAPDVAALIAARAVQGLFAAVLAPSALSLLAARFYDSDKREIAFGVFGAVGGGGAAVGLLLGGTLTEYLDWRWTLYVNVAIAVLALTGTVLFIERDTATTRPHIDLFGTVTISAALFAIVFGMAHAETDGWSDGLTLGLLIAGGGLLVAFPAVEHAVSQPLLPLRIFADRARSGALLALFMGAVGMFAMFLFVTYYMQDTLGYSAIRCGVAFLPLTAGVVVAASFGSQYLAPRIPARIVLPVALLLCGGSLALLTRLGAHASFASGLLPSDLLFGVGVGLVFSIGIGLATIGVEGEDAGVASGLVNTMQQVGGSIGIALLSTIAGSATDSYIRSHHRTAASTGSVLTQASVHGYVTVYWVAAGVFAVGALITAICLPTRALDSEPA